jgi:hypothetical protein
MNTRKSSIRSRKWVVIPILACLGILGLVALYVLVSVFKSAGPVWPEIGDPAKLRHDATSLCEAYDGQIPSSAWPESIAVLHPRAVFSNGKSVGITLSFGGISALPWGYIVWPDTVQRADSGVTKYDAAKESR